MGGYRGRQRQDLLEGDNYKQNFRLLKKEELISHAQNYNTPKFTN